MIRLLIFAAPMLLMAGPPRLPFTSLPDDDCPSSWEELYSELSPTEKEAFNFHCQEDNPYYDYNSIEECAEAFSEGRIYPQCRSYPPRPQGNNTERLLQEMYQSLKNLYQVLQEYAPDLESIRHLIISDNTQE